MELENENHEKLENTELEEVVYEEVKGFAYFVAWLKTFPLTGIIMLVAIVLFGASNYYALTLFKNYPENTSYALGLLKTGGVLGGPAQLFIWDGQLWRLFVNLFQHGNFLHIFFNLYALYFFGAISERFMGKINYLLFIIFCGVFQQTICQLTIEPGAIGLSGIIYGLFGFLWILKDKKELKGFITKDLSKAMFAQFFIFIILTYFDLMNIANIGHLSGFTYGVLFALAVYKNHNLFKIIAFTLSHLLLIPSIMYIYEPVYDKDWQEWKKEQKQKKN
jgi:rhomboid protease GluP